ncbi:sulfatase [Paenibacillus hemerocallicola]|uniref:Sulfatase n=1 Tax=Paenibacillus hemerocallicola TaxID=1172614 RepID=A0A5C4TF79_9BACL|nr:sulfatase [Paenibacillus hemerocallicola]TNJ67763.1 sulfatase [Paenibacillus hemerocallicola]
MKAILVLFDSLNRHMLEPYGCDWVHTPNFKRLSERTVRFTRSYVGSMPCMPARRDLHTGRLNFLHNSWGPLEPFDRSVPELLSRAGTYTHLVSDHYHYWEAGGATYHTKYDSWEFSRGQEGDPWKGEVKDPVLTGHSDRFNGHALRRLRQDRINRTYMQKEEDHSQSRTFRDGIEFIDTNHSEDNWFLQIEAFDPHEPFFAPESYKKLYSHVYEGPDFDWVRPGPVTETPDQVNHLRHEYAALVSMCDAQLGRVMDRMDQYGMWEDTMLIVATDHGYLLSEHDYWGKNVMPLYAELSNTPLFIWDPRTRQAGRTCDALVQWIDLAPTLLGYFGVSVPSTMLGHDLVPVYGSDETKRDAILFGYHGAHVNCTDGRYVYMRAPVRADNTPLYDYTLMPSHMNAMYTVEELRHIELAEPFSFTQGCRTMKIAASNAIQSHTMGTLLFDLQTDPGQLYPLSDERIEQHMRQLMIRLMQQNDAPPEQYERLGLVPDSIVRTN